MSRGQALRVAAQFGLHCLWPKCHQLLSPDVHHSWDIITKIHKEDLVKPTECIKERHFVHWLLDICGAWLWGGWYLYDADGEEFHGNEVPTETIAVKLTANTLVEGQGRLEVMQWCCPPVEAWTSIKAAWGRRSCCTRKNRSRRSWEPNMVAQLQKFVCDLTQTCPTFIDYWLASICMPGYAWLEPSVRVKGMWAQQ